jgi:hypothetical protein
MLKLTAIEFIVRTIPEAFVYIFAGYAFSNSKFNIKKYITASIAFAISVYFIRIMPINYGVHTILSIIIQAIILISISKINVIIAVKSSIITTICLFILELLNLLALNFIFKEQVESIMLNPISKTISGLPSLGVFAIIAFCYYRLKNKEK